MKKVLFVAITTLMISGLGFAQENVREGKRKKMEKHLIEKLNLTENQQVKLKEINANYEDELIALRDEMKQARDSENKEQAKEVRTELKEVLDAKSAEIELILDDEQLATYKEMKAKMKERRKEKRAKRN